MKFITKNSSSSSGSSLSISSRQGDHDLVKEEESKKSKSKTRGNIKSRSYKQQQPRTRTLEFCIISAQDLKSTSKFGRMRCYAVASISPDRKVSTRVDSDGGTNPTWDAKLALEADERVFSSDDDNDDYDDPTAQLTIEIYSRGSLRDKLVGTVRILVGDAVRERSDMRSVVNRFPVAAYLVFRPGGYPQGILNVCIPPGGRFPERTDSISFTRDEEGGRIPRRVGSSLRRSDEDNAGVASSISSSFDHSTDHRSSSSTSVSTATVCSSELTA